LTVSVTDRDGLAATQDFALPVVSALANASAASYRGETLARAAIAAAFGAALASRTEAAATLPLPTELAGVRLSLKDANGAEQLAPLFFVSPAQINYQIPAGAQPGAATIAVVSGGNLVAAGVVSIVNIAPGLFAANANGQGIAAALALRLKADGSQVYEMVSIYDASQQRFVPLPINLGQEGEQVYLILFGTGLRNFSSLSVVTARECASRFCGRGGRSGGSGSTQRRAFAT
jgi:uncharacterized protein (TIGR03437 family)